MFQAGQDRIEEICGAVTLVRSCQICWRFLLHSFSYPFYPETPGLMPLYAPCLIIYLRIHQLYAFGAYNHLLIEHWANVNTGRYARQITCILFNATSSMRTSIQDPESSVLWAKVVFYAEDHEMRVRRVDACTLSSILLG